MGGGRGASRGATLPQVFRGRHHMRHRIPAVLATLLFALLLAAPALAAAAEPSQGAAPVQRQGDPAAHDHPPAFGHALHPAARPSCPGRRHAQRPRLRLLRQPVSRARRSKPMYRSTPRRGTTSPRRPTILARTRSPTSPPRPRTSELWTMPQADYVARAVRALVDRPRPDHVRRAPRRVQRHAVPRRPLAQRRPP